MKRCLFSLSLVLFFLGSLFAQTGSIEGMVNDSEGYALIAVHVHIHTLGKGALTDEKGRFELKAVPVGSHELHFSHVGYQDIDRMVEVKAGETTSITVQLGERSTELSEVSVTGSPVASDPLHATTEVDILGGSNLREVQRAGLGRSIDQIAGVKSIQTGSQFGKPVIRGLSGNRIRILLQGVPLDYQQFGVRHTPNIDPFLADRIELVQGPNSVLYGSDAMGGAINVFPLKPPYGHTGESQVYGTVLSSYESNAKQYTEGIKMSGTKGGFGFAGSLIYRSSGDIRTPDVRVFSDPDGREGDPKFSGTLDHTDYKQLNGTFTAEYRGSFGSLGINYTAWSNEHSFLLPDGSGAPQYLSNQTVRLYGQIPVNDQWTFKHKFTFLSNLRQEAPEGTDNSAFPQKGEQAELDILRNAWSVRLDLVNRDLGRFSGRTGIDFRYTDQDSRGLEEPLVPSGNITEVGGYIFQKIDFDALTLNAGIRGDIRQQEAEPNAELMLPDSNETDDVLDQSYLILSGSLGANYQWTEHLSVSASLARGFRAPGFFDLHVEGIHGGIAAYQSGDPGLDPEISWNKDLSVKWRSDRFRFKATAYHNLIDDYIFLVNTGEFSGQGPPILANVQGRAVLYGGHFDLEAGIISHWSLRIYGEMVRGENRDDALEEVDELPLLPSDEIGAGIRYDRDELGPLKNFYISGSLSHHFDKEAAGRYEPFWQFGSEFPFGVASTDAYTLVTLKLGAAVPFNGRTISLDLWVDNLFDTAYRDFLDTYKGYALSPGRNFGIKIQVPFLSVHKPEER